ncbi:formate hydrogenlyase complex iron-sulfur subunit [Anoxybacillus flavithermus NBRC 109594]|uniref:Formate hydrogenlyase complex iron-sulfur subunit n=1 Tax=Anoxybacillus flavithermus NBRC 109594 TaxID=1315967 RepID=R4FGU0_9BACL|nr:4Fe-4S dicluster domain-containing protein [Anoxybacillus flavithermus]GAC92150.1 formate hydrogenlyase complex iron-sulfur subunit [Anoxybacillus flavithermus NBRC 109594]
MFDLVKKIWKTKTVTKTDPLTEAPKRFRGKPMFVSNECTGCRACITSCPAKAITLEQNDDSSTISLSLSYANCIFCGICAEVCETNTIQITNEYRLATKNKTELTVNKQLLRNF